MSVRISLHPYFLEEAGINTLEVSGTTVGECLNNLVSKFPTIKDRLFEAEGKLHWSVFVFVNGGSAAPDHLAKKVKDGDQIEIIPLIRASTGG